MPHLMTREDLGEMYAILLERGATAEDARWRVLDAEARGYALGHEDRKTRQAAFKARSEAKGEEWRADMVRRIKEIRASEAAK